MIRGHIELHKRTSLKNFSLFQISEKFLVNQVNSSNSVFGPPGQNFLYEWTKFRYGVFEEHGYPGDPLYPMFYSKQIFTAEGARTDIRPNFCSNLAVTGNSTDNCYIIVYKRFCFLCSVTLNFTRFYGDSGRRYM